MEPSWHVDDGLAGLATFFALTFALTWTTWIVPAVFAPGNGVLRR